MYKKRKHSKSGFEKYCKVQLNRVKKARHAGSRSKSALKYQKCLQNRGITDTGLGKKKEKK